MFNIRKWKVLENPQGSAVKASATGAGGALIEHQWHDHPQRVWGRFFTKKGALKRIAQGDDRRLSKDLNIESINEESRTIAINSYQD